MEYMYYIFYLVGYVEYIYVIDVNGMVFNKCLWLLDVYLVLI